MALMKLCPVCNKKIPYANKYCIECTKTKEERQTNSNRYYDKSVRKNKDNKVYDSFYHSMLWLKVRKVAVVRDYGLCSDCLKADVVTAYNVVHHIAAIKDDYSKRLDIDNLTCLCEEHHQLRHKNME